MVRLTISAPSKPNFGIRSRQIGSRVKRDVDSRENRYYFTENSGRGEEEKRVKIPEKES
jgi:hypothetical protein